MVADASSRGAVAGVALSPGCLLDGGWEGCVLDGGWEGCLLDGGWEGCLACSRCVGYPRDWARNLSSRSFVEYCSCGGAVAARFWDLVDSDVVDMLILLSSFCAGWPVGWGADPAVGGRVLGSLLAI